MQSITKEEWMAKYPQERRYAMKEDKWTYWAYFWPPFKEMFGRTR